MKAKDTLIIQLTIEELINILDTRYLKNVDHSTERVIGISGIAHLFGCSPATAQRIKSSGVIDGAITQVGRTFVVDVDKALNMVQNSSTIWAKKYNSK